MVLANDNLQSFLDLKIWYSIITNGLEKLNRFKKQCKLILVKNKIDLTSTIDDSLISYFIQIDTKFKGTFNISCKTNEGFDHLSKWIEGDLFNT